MMPRMTTERFIEKAVEVHGPKYDYSKTEYLETRKPVTVICPVHGEFSHVARSHLQGNGCKHCQDDSRRMSTEDWIVKATKTHGDRFDYSQAHYTGSHQFITIVCRLHGPFEQRAYMHLQDRGCRACAYLNHPGGYTYMLFEEDRKLANTQGAFYVVEYTFPDEAFIKIGITRHTAYTRHKSYWSKVKVLSERKMRLQDAFHHEQVLLHRPEMQEYRYTPSNLNAGVTECFTLEVKPLLF